MITITPSRATAYISNKLKLLQELYVYKFDYVLFLDTQEIKGVVDFLYALNIIDKAQRDDYYKELYKFEELSGVHVSKR